MTRAALRLFPLAAPAGAQFEGTRRQFDMGEQWPPEKSQDVDGLTIYLWTIK